MTPSSQLAADVAFSYGGALIFGYVILRNTVLALAKEKSHRV